MDAVSFSMDINGERRKVTYDNFDLDSLVFIDDELMGEIVPTSTGWAINSPELSPYASAIMDEVHRLEAKYTLDLNNLIPFVAWTRLEADNTLLIGIENNISFEGFNILLTVHIQALNYQPKGCIKLYKAGKNVDFNI